MFSQGRNMLNALLKANSTSTSNRAPDLSRPVLAAPTSPASPNSTHTPAETESSDADSLEYSPSESAILNQDWASGLQGDPEFITPSSASVVIGESPQSSRPGSELASFADLQPWQNLSCGYTPDSRQNHGIVPSNDNIRKQLFTASEAEVSRSDSLDIIPLERATYLTSQGNNSAGQTGNNLSYISDIQAELGVPLVTRSSSALEDMFHNEDIENENMSFNNYGSVTQENFSHGTEYNQHVHGVMPDHLQQEEAENVPISVQEQQDNDIVPETVQQQEEINVPENILQVQGNAATRKRARSSPNDNSPTRKRSRNPSATKAEVAKLAYNSGQAHVTTKGKQRAQREIRKSCTATCRRNCKEKITNERRQKLFGIFYGSKSKEAQWMIIGKLVKRLPKKRCTVAGTPTRKSTYHYFLTDEKSNYIPVCQPFFLGTFDISKTVVETAMSKNSPDKRGKQVTNRPKRISAELKNGVKDHIKLFPKIASHYCRESTKREYLDENLSIAKMYRMYITARGKNTPHTATNRQYRDVFNTCFNLGFYQPKKDQCSLCMRWKNLQDGKDQVNSDVEFVQKYQEHETAKKLARDFKQESKDLSRSEQNKDGKMKVICFDLEKVFFCPKSEVGEFFYKRKLSCYNFTVFDCTLKKGTCFVWDQTTAGRGAVEISSCVYKYIQQESLNGLEELHIYSDSCWSQNKNQVLYSMYYAACQKFKLKIIHRYLEKGHTQMECDSVHATIERKISKIDIFTPSEWFGYIRSAKVNKPQYAVVEVQTEDIVSFKELSQQNFSWKKIPVSKIHEITVDCKTQGKISYKKKLSDPQTEYEVLMIRPGRPIAWANYKPPRVYPGRLSLKPMLVNDLKWMTKQKLIPDRALEFYQNVTSPTFGTAVILDEEVSTDNEFPQEIAHNNEALDAVLEGNHGGADTEENVDDDLE
ncbi:hypothetical protein FOCC_FOCC016335 [Frankliniella occidentalis]|nr:hypothetical protein FOCC_FOCC016335 [Frankliniella occidentalis]